MQIIVPKRWTVTLGLCSCLFFCVGLASADETTLEPPAIQVPAGFVIEPVAQPPLVKYPMLGTFDDAGRLFVCESAGTNLDAQQLQEKLPNFVRMLEDTDGDGRFDKSTNFADNMTLPSGAVWYDGALYVASPPSIWRLEDRDGDGIADRRDEIITGFHFRGHAGDIHGPYLGPDGRLYCADGHMGHTIRDKSGKLLSQGSASRVFSSRLDGSGLETFCGGGMSNLVAVTFSDEGEMFGIATFFYYNTQRVRHDGFFHGVYGGVYPKPQAILRKEFKLTGPLLPALTRYGMSAPSSLTAYRSGAFGKEFQGNIFISHFNTRSVTRARLHRDGSTFRADESPFLVSSSPDFHACDVIEDADGSLLVIDTGGWFKIGCPTSSQQPQVQGGIYRVRRVGQKTLSDPRGLKIAWDKTTSSNLATLLNDDRFTVRDRAIATLAKRGELAINPLRKVLSHGSLRARRGAVWALTRIASPAALTAARSALDDSDPSVRLVAASCAATHRDGKALPQLVKIVVNDESAIRRQAAAALGRIGIPKAVPALLNALEEDSDHMLEHAIIYGLIEIDNRQATLAGLQNPSPHVRRGTLIALDQMENGKLTRKDVAPLLITDDRELTDAVVDVVSRHPSWGGMVSGLLKKWLLQADARKERQGLLRETLLALRADHQCQSLIGEVLAAPVASAETRILLLDVIARSGFRELPATWRQPVSSNLESADARVVKSVLVAMSSTAAGQFDEELSKFVQETARPVAQRVRAAGVLARDRAALSQQTFQLLCGQSGQDADFETRLEAARALGNAKLTAKQIDVVIGLISQAGSLELPVLLNSLNEVWEQPAAIQVGKRIITALQQARGFVSLSENQLTALFEQAPTEVRTAARPLFHRIAEEQSQSIRQVLRTTFNVAGGDAVRGKEIFFGQRALCSACHRLESSGKAIGPDLSRIGEVRNHRDLLESILLPSVSFARGFSTKTVVTKSGRVYSGVIRNDTDDPITLYTSQREEIRIARRDVEKIVPATVSIMPRGLERSLTSDDLRDLLAYLSSLKGSAR